jgi:hypothetical protein
MRSGWFIIAAVWGLGYSVSYLLVIRGQDGSPAWWYVALLLFAVAVCGCAGFVRSSLAWVVGSVAAVCWSVAAVLGLLTIGVFLLPAVGFTATGLVRAARRAQRS